MRLLGHFSAAPIRQRPLIIHIDKAIQICRENKPQHIWNEEPRSHRASTRRIYDISKDRNIQRKNNKQAQERTLQCEETDTPQKVKQELQQP